MVFSKEVRRWYKKLNGLFPVYKPAGIHQLDVLDWIKYTINWDLWDTAQLNTGGLGVKVSGAPSLMRKPMEGLMIFGLGKDNLHLSNIKYGDFVYRVEGRLGARHPDVLRGGAGIEDPWQCRLDRPASHVTKEDFFSYVQSMSQKEFIQVRIPLEPEERSFFTELNRSSPSWKNRNTIFYEGTQPSRVIVHDISDVSFNEETKSFTFLIEATGSICIFRFVDDLGLKLDTFATIDKVVLQEIQGVTVDTALRKHSLYLNDILSSISKHRQQFNDLTDELQLRGRPIKLRFKCPW